MKNINRVFYLDIARALAVIFMVMQHAVILFEKSAGEGKDLIGNIFLLLGTAPAAPVFMVIMGIFLMKSKKTMKQNIVRGIKLFISGYALNLIRFIIPIFIESNFNIKALNNSEVLDLFFSVDILQLAGLATIFCSILKRFITNKFTYLIIGVFILFISPLLWGFDNQSIWSSAIIGTSSISYFPFFPWVYYVLLGMFLSSVIFEENIHYNKIIIKYVLINIVLGLVSLSFTPIGDYHRSGAAVHFLISAFVLLWFMLIKKLTNKANLQSLTARVFSILSKEVTSIYYIQWIIYGWTSILVINRNSFSGLISMTLGFVVLMITYLIVTINSRLKSSIIKKT